MREWKGYRKGINLGGWFAQNDHLEKTYDTFITEDDFKVFSKWGIDHVRIPFDYHLLEDQYLMLLLMLCSFCEILLT